MAAQRTPKLDRKLVAETALALLNEVGLDGLTLRVIARELDVKAPALYWHFKDKQALLDEMATEMMRRMAVEPRPEWADDWREAIRAQMRGLRAQLLRYRDGAKVYSGTRFTDISYAEGMEANLRRLTKAGFTPRAAARAAFTAYSYTIGYVIEEQAMGPATFEGAAEAGAAAVEAFDLDARAERLAAYPLSATAGAEMFRDMDGGFEAGLEAVLAGIGATLRSAQPFQEFD
ncbi:Tetracyclin repressor domain-containing protein [Actinobacteria bacterium OK074]|nr:Tetracyclin repressor domain-containing protein [Actinobacteria bacterium OK074]